MIASHQSFSGVAYPNRTTGTHGALNEKRNIYYNGTKEQKKQLRQEMTNVEATGRAQPRGTERPRGTASTSTSSSSNPREQWRNRFDRVQDSTVKYLLQSGFRPSNLSRGATRTRITITDARLRRLSRLSDDQLNEFIRHAPITSQARSRIRRMQRERG